MGTVQMGMSAVPRHVMCFECVMAGTGGAAVPIGNIADAAPALSRDEQRKRLAEKTALLKESFSLQTVVVTSLI